MAARRARLRVALAALAAVLGPVLLGACQVRTAVRIDVGTDGAGVVRVGVGLDDEAARRLPDLAGDLRVEDLRAAGWAIVGPQREADGRIWVRASKPFATPAEMAQVMAEVGGPTGPFRGFAVLRRTGLWRSRTEVRGTVDLRRGLEALGDDDLRRRLGGSSLGVPVQVLERQLGSSLDRVFMVQVDVLLPGEVISSNAGHTSGGTARWRLRLGEQVALDAVAEVRHVRRLVGATLAAAAAATLLAWAGLARRTAARRPPP